MRTILITVAVLSLLVAGGLGAVRYSELPAEAPVPVEVKAAPDHAAEIAALRAELERLKLQNTYQSKAISGLAGIQQTAEHMARHPEEGPPVRVAATNTWLYIREQLENAERAAKGEPIVTPEPFGKVWRGAQ